MSDLREVEIGVKFNATGRHGTVYIKIGYNTYDIAPTYARRISDILENAARTATDISWGTHSPAVVQEKPEQPTPETPARVAETLSEVAETVRRNVLRDSVLQAINRGCSHREIAAQMGISLSRISAIRNANKAMK